MDKKTIEVVAAVIKKEECILATQRGYGEFKGKWEFPGGKINEGENLENALIREIKEETNADINVLNFLCTVNYEYPNFNLIMHCFICELVDDKIEFVYHNNNELEHDNMIWLELNDLDHLDWLPADVEVVKALKKN